MPKLARLYLDTARLGLMSPSAQLAARDFARLAGEGVSTLYWQRFFRDGHGALEPHLRAQLAGLATWQGIEQMKAAIRQLLRAAPVAPVYLTGRATSLLHSIVHCLLARCRNVLVADTLWPPYRQILENESARRGCQITAVKVRQEILCRQITPPSIIARVKRVYQRHKCDGIVLSSVSHDGIRLPVEEILVQLRTASHVKLAIVDGAQELGHMPVDLSSAGVDAYLAGCHKWLGGNLPLGVCCLSRPATAGVLQMQLNEVASHTTRADPLQAFVSWLQRDTSGKAGNETVNALPLLCAAGALSDTLHSLPPPKDRLFGRLTNQAAIVSLSKRTGWRAQVPPSPYRTGILILRSERTPICRLTANALQARFDATGITITAWGSGQVRLALPNRPLSASQLAAVENALAAGNQLPTQ